MVKHGFRLSWQNTSLRLKEPFTSVQKKGQEKALLIPVSGQDSKPTTTV